MTSEMTQYHSHKHISGAQYSNSTEQLRKASHVGETFIASFVCRLLADTLGYLELHTLLTGSTTTATPHKEARQNIVQYRVVYRNIFVIEFSIIH